MCKNAVLDVFEPANVQIKHQNHIQWLIKVISGHKNFTSGLNMSLPVSLISIPVPSEPFKDHLSISEVNLGHFRCHWSVFRSLPVSYITFYIKLYTKLRFKRFNDNFWVFCTETAYEVIIWKFRGGGQLPQVAPPPPPSVRLWCDLTRVARAITGQHGSARQEVSTGRIRRIGPVHSARAAAQHHTHLQAHTHTAPLNGRPQRFLWLAHNTHDLTAECYDRLHVVRQ